MNGQATAKKADDEPIDDRTLWYNALNLHRQSESGYSNGLHIYFELKRVRDAARKKETA